MKKILITSMAMLLSFTLVAQNNDLTTALQLKADSKFPESFAIFQQLLKSDSGNVVYLANTSILYCKMGLRQTVEAKKQQYYHKGEYLALKAIKANNNNADAHYAYAFALGRINEFAGSKQKIANAKTIKAECDKTLSIDPNYAGAYHILGRWHRTVAGFSSIERLMINSFFGGVPPGGTYDDAIKSFSKAITLEPKYILHQYELAMTYYERDAQNDMNQVKSWAERALKCPINNIDDEGTKKKAIELLSKVK